MKPAAFQATPILGSEASRVLVQQLRSVQLTDQRRAQLSQLAKEAQRAFCRPLPTDKE